MEKLNTHCLSQIELDKSKLEYDLNVLGKFKFSDPYGEFHFGRCVCCYLWNRDGNKDEPFLSNYIGNAQPTEYGKKLRYLADIVESNFNVEQLQFVRIAKLLPHSIIIPHRDYIELDNAFSRIHVPLKTDNNILFGDEHNVYNLKLGEVWYLDASNVHSIASFSSNERIHMILDFMPSSNIELLFKNPLGNMIRESSYNVQIRPELSQQEQEAIDFLYHLIDPHNYKEILGILIRKYFQKNMPLSSVYECLLKLAQKSGNASLIEEVEKFVAYFLRVRSNEWSPELIKDVA